MNLEPIIQSEVSQKEKDKYRILIHICGIICRAAMEMQTENRPVGARRDVCRVTGTLTLPYVK